LTKLSVRTSLKGSQCDAEEGSLSSIFPSQSNRGAADLQDALGNQMSASGMKAGSAMEG